MREFTLTYQKHEDSYEYRVRFKGSEREHIFDRFEDVVFFFLALGIE